MLCTWCLLWCVWVDLVLTLFHFFFFKQKTAYEMRISDWSSDVCSSDLAERLLRLPEEPERLLVHEEEMRLEHSRRVLDDRRPQRQEIGRASCREGVSVRVDLGGRRIIKKKKYKK